MQRKVTQSGGKEGAATAAVRQRALKEIKPERQDVAGWLLNQQRAHGNHHVQRMLREAAPRSRCSCGGTCSSCQASERQRKQGIIHLALRQSLRATPPHNDQAMGPTVPHLSRARFGADFSSVIASTEAHAARDLTSDTQPAGPPVRTKKIAGVDVTKSDCGCIDKLTDEIDWAKSQVKRYSDCKADPANKTGKNIEDCVHAQHAKEGISTVVAGTTSSTGVVTVKKTKGPCAAIMEKGTEIHEGVHSNHQVELVKMYGKGTPAFTAHWENDAQDWAQDEMNAYGAEIPFYQRVIAHLQSVCGWFNKTGGIVGGILGAVGGIAAGLAVGGWGGAALGAGIFGAGILGGGLLGNLFED